MIISILTGLKVEKSDLKTLKRQFQILDSNQDGTLDVNEFKQICSKVSSFSKEFKESFKDIDLDGNGRIDFAEFQTATINKRRILTKQSLQEMFNIFDINHDGKIDISEFIKVLPSVDERQIKHQLSQS